MKNKVIVTKTARQQIRLSIAKKIEKVMVKKNLSLKNLLDDIKAERKRHVLQIVKK